MVLSCIAWNAKILFDRKYVHIARLRDSMQFLIQGIKKQNLLQSATMKKKLNETLAIDCADAEMLNIL